MSSINQTDLAAFLAAERQVESGNDYTITNSIGASGAYQYIQSTWTSEAKAAGYPQWASGPAASAPPAVQDAVAAFNASNDYKASGDWAIVAGDWYDPAYAHDPSFVPPGNTLSIGQYENDVSSIMNKILKAGGSPSLASTSIPSSSTTSSSSSTASSNTASSGFLKSFDNLLNPSVNSLDPFTDTAHAINLIIIRGGIAIGGLLIMAAGLVIMGIGLLSSANKAISGSPDSNDRRAIAAENNPGPNRNSPSYKAASKGVSFLAEEPF